MSALAVLALAACTALAPERAPDRAAVDALLADERYAEALAATDELEGVERHRLRVRTLHHAGDLTGALGAARVGLEAHPGDPELLLAATDVALVLGAPAAEALGERLDAAVASLPAAHEHRAWWEGKAARYRELTGEQRAARDARRAAERRARWIACVGTIGAGVALVALATRAR